MLYLVGFILPKKIELERSVLIEAPIDSVFNQVSNLKKFSEWTPWATYDPNMKKEFEGAMGEVGSIYKWSGNDNVGSGSMKIKAIKPNVRIDLSLEFVEPYTSNSDIYFLFSEINENTEVVWGYVEKNLVPKNVINAIFGVKKMLSEEFDKGLSSLKRKCE